MGVGNKNVDGPLMGKPKEWRWEKEYLSELDSTTRVRATAQKSGLVKAVIRQLGHVLAR